MNLTSGGIDSGARPICDGRFEEAENDRKETAGKAGRRNAGIDTEATEGAVTIALSSPFERAVDSMTDLAASVMLFCKMYLAFYFLDVSWDGTCVICTHSAVSTGLGGHSKLETLRRYNNTTD